MDHIANVKFYYKHHEEQNVMAKCRHEPTIHNANVINFHSHQEHNVMVSCIIYMEHNANVLKYNRK